MSYAINPDLTISFLGAFSTPDGDEVAYGISEDELLAQHPHAIALRAALAGYGPTAHDYDVRYASNGRHTRISLTCTDPDSEMSHCDEHFEIIRCAGLEVADGLADESGDHAMVRPA